jgi:hypothetical protein
LDYKDFNYDSFSLIDCIYLLQSMINSPHAYEQNKAFTKHLVDAMTIQLDDISRGVCNLQSKYAFAESLLGKYPMHKLP